MGKKKDSSGNKGGSGGASGLLIFILLPVIITFLASAIFFASLNGITGIITGVVTSVINFFSDPIGEIVEVTGTIINNIADILDMEIFAAGQYQSYTSEPRVFISKEEFESMADGLTGAINREEIGLDDITIKKILLTYYRSMYTTGTTILIELNEDEAHLNNQKLKPFRGSDIQRLKKTEDSEELPYLTTTGIISFENDGRSLHCYTQEGLTLMHQEYVNENNSDRGQAIEEYLRHCYTIDISANTIQMYGFNNVTTKEKYTSNNNGTFETETNNVGGELITLDYRINISKFTTPMEFLVQLMQITGSQDFILEFLDLIYEKTEIEMAILEIEKIEEEISTNTYTQNHTVTGVKTDDEGNQEEGTVSGAQDSVTVETTKTTTECKYDIVIKKASTWYAEITDNDTVQQSTIYYTKDSEGNLIEISNIDEREIISLSGTESEPFNVAGEAGANYVYSAPGTAKEKFIEKVFDNTDTDDDYDYYIMNTTKSNRTQNTIIETKLDFIVPGTQNFTGRPDDFLDLLRNRTTGKPKEYDSFYGGKSVVGDLLVNGAEMLFELLDTSHTVTDEENNTQIEVCNTVGLSDVMKYILYMYSGIDFGVTELIESILDLGSLSGIGSIYGNNFEEKVWWALIDAGFSKEATAGAMGNFYGESSFRSNNLENTFESILGYTDETYTEAIDSNRYTLQQFISDHTYENAGAGYGLAQWTWYTRKERSL